MSAAVVVGVGTIGVSVVSVASTSIAGSTSGAAGADGAVGSTGSGSTVSAGAGVADSRKAIASVPNCASTAALNVPISRSVNVTKHT